jgi:hypothetical protein
MRIAGAIRAPVPVLCMPRAYPLARVAVTARYLAAAGRYFCQRLPWVTG